VTPSLAAPGDTNPSDATGRLYRVAVCREPNIEDTDEYIDTWQESLGQTVTTGPSAKSRCKLYPPLTPKEFTVARSAS